MIIGTLHAQQRLGQVNNLDEKNCFSAVWFPFFKYYNIIHTCILANITNISTTKTCFHAGGEEQL